jgi:hypothetical protein
MRAGIIAFATLLVGVAAGFVIARAFPPGNNVPVDGGPGASAHRTPVFDEVLVQYAVLKNVDKPGKFDVHYPRLFAAPPALEITDRNGATPSGWDFVITEQRADGFTITITTHGGGRSNESPLAYSARGLASDGLLRVQEGEALVPTGKPGELEVFYRTPFPSPPHLIFPGRLNGVVVKDQKATGFKLLRDEQSGLSHLPVKWRAEQLILRKDP